MGIQAIGNQHTVRPATAPAAKPPAAASPSLHDKIGTGFSQFFRDHQALGAQPKGKAATTLSLGERWKKLDGAEKFFVGLHGVVGSAAIATCAVAGAKGGFRGAGIKGALIGAGVGAVATAGTVLIMDTVFTYGSMVTTGAIAKLAGLKK